MRDIAVNDKQAMALRPFRQGKVRDIYELGDGSHLLLVASDRISAFDVVLPTVIPGKGRLLTALSEFWFRQTAGLVENHLVSTEIPGDLGLSEHERDDLHGRTMVVRRAKRIDVECVIRGYLAGSAWEEYQRSGMVAGEPVPSGLPRAAKLPAPIFTPAVKHDRDHDVTISPSQLANMVGAGLAGRLEEISRDLYDAASQHALDRGIILADTKYEFGWIDGKLTLIDELLTPDSSRFWDASTWTPGIEPPSFDKQFVRNWLLSTNWNRQPPVPDLPDDVVAGTLERYQEAYARLTGYASGEIG
ncbi:MAG TPA: phosphoribosylaminoimidazolesuccinocarboxamide synthase [Thermomicrobiales bacterium]|nr:phosphoribosylaminoimidazolesuccinocarboxamide synthase [Thermomicrobiales bacterium]